MQKPASLNRQKTHLLEVAHYSTTFPLVSVEHGARDVGEWNMTVGIRWHNSRRVLWFLSERYLIRKRLAFSLFWVGRHVTSISMSGRGRISGNLKVGCFVWLALPFSRELFACDSLKALVIVKHSRSNRTHRGSSWFRAHFLIEYVLVPRQRLRKCDSKSNSYKVHHSH